MAILLIMIGVVGLFIEFTHTGLVVPGFLGGICLLLGLFALQVASQFCRTCLAWIGHRLHVGRSFPSELRRIGSWRRCRFCIGRHRADGCRFAGYGMPLAVIVMAAILSALLIATLGGLALCSWRRASVIGDSELLGAVAEVVDVTPEQVWVYLHGERWQAQCRTPLRREQRVRVVARRALLLEVEAVDAVDAINHAQQAGEQ